MKTLHLAVIVICCAVSVAYPQTAQPAATPRPDSLLNRTSSSGALPGLVARGYLGGDHPALESPTPIVFIIKTGSEFPDVIRPLMENELRGTADIGRLEYSANGFIILESDTEVHFDISNMVCNVNGKDFGNGDYKKPLKKGKHTLELIRRGWASGKPSFSITDAATNQPVVFHTAEALKREASRSVKIANKTTKSKVIGPVTE